MTTSLTPDEVDLWLLTHPNAESERQIESQHVVFIDRPELITVPYEVLALIRPEQPQVTHSGGVLRRSTLSVDLSHAHNRGTSRFPFGDIPLPGVLKKDQYK